MIPNRVDDPMFTNMRLPGQRSSQSCYSGDPKSAAPTVVTDPDAIGCSCEGLGLQLRRVMLRCDVETRCFYASWLEGLLCALSEKPCKTSCLWKKSNTGKILRTYSRFISLYNMFLFISTVRIVLWCMTIIPDGTREDVHLLPRGADQRT